MSHFIQKCKVCHVVITQCRCPSPDKLVTYVTCVRCALKAQQIAECPDAKS